ncbi:hypothetical protein ID866_7089 [Astraeus odoratus]|nr:hypothetical protein ID866_7089 [Astraeus odoratus]
MEAAPVPFVPSEEDIMSSPEPDAEFQDPERPTQTCPLRKRLRRRSSSPAVSVDQLQFSLSRQGTDEPQRDTTYYMSDGSCILLVGKTLFNVHRSILSRDSSSFATLFTLPQGDTPEEGTCDERPIVLQGDTPDEFRNFLWALYALPHEIMAVRSPQVNLNRLIDVAKISNKYSFKATELWALDAIQKHIEKKPSPLLNIPLGFPFSTNPPASALRDSKAQISRLIRLAQTCAHQKLLDTMVSLLRQLMSSSLHFSYLAMTLADELNLKELRGHAYMEVLQKSMFLSGRNSDGSAMVEGDIQETAEGRDRLVVSPIQQHRLLAGYYRLSKTWDRLRAVPLAFEHAPSCGANWHQHSCMQSWIEFWKEKTRADVVLSVDAAHVVERLSFILKEFDKWGSATHMHQDCKTMAKRAMQDKIRSVQESLSDFFYEGVQY